jgi:crotonobetainyl-CoA:carnitine CoA-transferase CaiB-like acyl-CoA transferase
MRAGVPAGVVNSVPEAFAQPHVAHRQLLVRSSGYTGIRSPVLLHDTPSSSAGKPPGFSQHSAEVLKELGLSDADIAQLQQSGVVSGKRRSLSKPSTDANG